MFNCLRWRQSPSLAIGLMLSICRQVITVYAVADSETVGTSLGMKELVWVTKVPHWGPS